MKKKLKIIWPIDPHQSHKKADRNLLNFLTLLRKKIDFELQPVTVVSADFYVTSEYFEVLDTRALIENMSQSCNDYLKGFRSLKPLPAVVLENHFSSQGAQAAVLSEYVKKEQADFCIMSSHGRKGWGRVLVGSFAETFLLHSTVPIFVLGPDFKKTDSCQKALIPVELGESSKKFISHLVQNEALEFLKSLCLFHKISIVDVENVAWAPTLYGLVDYDSKTLLKTAKKNTQKHFEDLTQAAGVKKRLKFEVSESLDGVAEVVVKRSRKSDVDLVVMRSEAGGLTARVLGSVAREIIRDSRKAVLVYPHRFS